MTSNAGSKRRRRDRARGSDVAYSQARPSTAAENGTRVNSLLSGLSREDLEQRLDQAEAAYGQADDPWRKQAGYDAASTLYDELAVRAQDPTTKHAMKLAGLMMRTFGARTRWAHGIPTIHPQTEAHLLGLAWCTSCGRASNAVDGTTPCEKCPQLRFGPTPYDAQDADQYGPGTPVDLEAVLTALSGHGRPAEEN
ncbi:hypothetical protein [Saccharothrix obliqua]|uniref:hypothetical protein n=1 Tax=Saccharothrix obliqua TaxID=2861747 RepID=UPI001C5D2A3B|nr:hypothetical protein [Saccharothrix obliqua]MBW4722419.1 hypothetical protein [Saccharothrix obliqua]